MPTSKFPHDLTPPSETLERFVRTADQWVAITTDQGYEETRPEAQPYAPWEDEMGSDARLLDYPVYSLIQGLVETMTQPTDVAPLALHFRGVSTEDGLATATVLLTGILWGEGRYPRLDFKRPAIMSRMIGCPQFWGGFIVAIAPLRSSQRIEGCADNDGSVFQRIVLEHGVIPIQVH